MAVRFGTVALLFYAPGLAQAAQPIGNAQVVVEQVTGEIGSEVRRLAAHDLVHLDEIVTTAADSATEIIFEDGTKVSLGPNTRMTLDRFVYDPGQSSSTFKMEVFEGVARFVSGQIADPAKSNFQISTPTVTIAIRGTTLTTVVDAQGATAALLGSASLVTVANAAGQQVALNAIGSATSSQPDGTLSPAGPLPQWAVARIKELDALLTSQTRNALDTDRSANVAAVSPPDPPAADPPAPPAADPPAPPAADPPAPPAPDPPAPDPDLGEERGVQRALGVASQRGVERGLSSAVERADTSARGNTDHGKGANAGGNQGGDRGAGADAGGDKGASASGDKGSSASGDKGAGASGGKGASASAGKGAGKGASAGKGAGKGAGQGAGRGVGKGRGKGGGAGGGGGGSGGRR